MLWNNPTRIQHYWVNMIGKLIFKCSSNYLKCPSLIMAEQILYIFQKKRARALSCNNSRNVEKQCALCWVSKTVCITERRVLSNTCY